MKVFMVSFDRALVGEGGTDAVERHRTYAEGVKKLTIIVVTPPGKYQHYSFGDHLEVYPTNARTLWGHARAIWGYFFSIRKHEGIDLLVAQDLATPVVFVLKLLARIPLIASVHGVWWDAWFVQKHWWHRLYLPLFTWTLKHVDAVRAVSQGLKEVLVERGIDEDAIHVIPTPVRLDRFAERDDKKVQEIQISQEYPIVLSVGRLEREKGFTALLKIWKCVMEAGIKARLLIIGKGSERKKLEQIIVDDFKDGSVVLRGQVESSDLPPYYHASSVFVLASESESFGKTLVEAGAAGIPSVATATRGASEIILNGTTGFLTPVGDEGAMAEKIIFLLKDRVHAEEMGKMARSRCGPLYDGKKNTEQILQLWQKVARTSRI